MTHVVVDSCIRCKYTDCVDVCPADCFHEGPNMLVIDPVECIDCQACIPTCPVGAIYPDDELPDHLSSYLDLNAELAAQWPVITEIKPPPPDADDWKGVAGKLQYLER